MTPDRGASPIDPLDLVLDALEPFEYDVVRLRYRAGRSLRSIAHDLSSTTEDVAAALMRAYRQVAAGLGAV